MLDLPEPFGPTITDTPGANVSFVRSGNDLKPLRLIELRCIGSERLQRCLGRGLLGFLLRAPDAMRQRLAVHYRHDLEGPLVRRPLLGDDVVGHDRAAPGQTLL